MSEQKKNNDYFEEETYSKVEMREVVVNESEEVTQEHVSQQEPISQENT